MQAREVRRITDERFVILAEVVLGESVLSPAAVIMDVRDGRVTRAAAYLSDEATLIAVGLIPSTG